MINRIGQKVVCIHDWYDRIPPGCTFPSRELVYTVRELVVEGDEPSIRLFEIRNPLVAFVNMTTLAEPAFVRWAFRPVVSGNADISIFREMLEPKPEKEVAE